MNEREFTIELSKLNIICNEKELQKFNIYYNILIEWNKKFNLTAITKKEEVYLKHFYDSAYLLNVVNSNKCSNILDIGTGAGFPGIVLAILNKELKVTLIESNKKKCMFLQEVIKKLNLENVNLINNRAENCIKENREKFDIVTCRAVSKLDIISEISIPFVKVGGLFAPLKSNITDELEKSKCILKKLNSKIEDTIYYKLPKEESKRTIILIRKNAKTNKKYPRQYNQILKTHIKN